MTKVIHDPNFVSIDIEENKYKKYRSQRSSLHFGGQFALYQESEWSSHRFEYGTAHYSHIQMHGVEEEPIPNWRSLGIGIINGESKLDKLKLFGRTNFEEISQVEICLTTHGDLATPYSTDPSQTIIHQSLIELEEPLSMTYIEIDLEMYEINSNSLILFYCRAPDLIEDYFWEINGSLEYVQ